MAVHNIHERRLVMPVARAGVLIDRLASPDEILWPRGRWPSMRFDRPLAVGASGGHGHIRYVVEDYQPGRSIRFKFTGPPGFNGHHRFDLEASGPDASTLRHTVEMRLSGRARLAWPLVIRPLHDALLEDALDRAETYAGGKPRARRWSVLVRFLRWSYRRKR